MPPTINFIEYGKGEPVVLLHGFAESIAIWEPFIPYLANSYHVIALDLPGFGKSKGMENAFQIEDIALTIVDFLQSRGIAHCSLIGHSLGGYVALAMAELSSDSIKKLVLFHSTAEADSKEKKHSRNKAIKFISENGGQIFLKSFIPPLFCRPSSEWVNRILHQASLVKPETLIAYTGAMKNRPDRQAVLNSPSIRTLIIAGEKDVILNPALLEKQSKSAKNTVFALMKDVGHMGMLEHPELSSTIILNFLSELPHLDMKSSNGKDSIIGSLCL